MPFYKEYTDKSGNIHYIPISTLGGEATGNCVKGSIYDGDKTVTISSQREAIASGVLSVWIKNTGSNVMRFRFGDGTVVSTLTAGFELAAGESDSYPISENHSDWAYIAATGGTTAAVVWGG